MSRRHLAVHRLLRRILPKRVRRLRGEEMDRTFLELLEHDEGDRTRLWGREIRDMVVTGVRLRRRGVAGERPRLAHPSWLDVKLGVRMLGKHPGLTAVAVFALSIGIPVGLAPWHLVNAIEGPLPVEEGARVLLLRYWNEAANRPGPTRVEELLQWRGLGGFESLGAARRTHYNLARGEETTRPVDGAEVTASTFDLLRVPPFLGRTLVAADETPGAPNVVVIAHELWRTEFGSEATAVGAELRIGGVAHTVVGVMPEGFLFPVRERLWLPLRERPGSVPFEGPPLAVFGRLADGVSIAEAHGELAATALRTADEFPETHARLRGEVVPFAFMITGVPLGGLRAQLGFYVVQFVTLLVLLVACTNVGLLIFARTATRSAELAVRATLGAGRARIVWQMFVESLVLALLAVGVGLILADQGLRFLLRFAGTPPYWFDFGVTWKTTGWALTLAVLSAVAAGVAPALKVTGKALQRSMQGSGASWTGRRFGGLSSLLIVIDVAVAVAIVGLAAAAADHLANLDESDSLGIRPDEYLSAYVQLPGMDPAPGVTVADRGALTARVASTQNLLVEALRAEPGVRGVAIGSRLPRMDHPGRRVEIEGEETTESFRGHQVQIGSIDVGFFDALDAPILAGRGFDSRDLGDNRSTVIVNTTFVEDVLGGGNPIGRRLRYAGARPSGEPGTWLEIVGVVDRLGMNMILPEQDAGMYHPAAPGEVHPILLGIRLGDDPASFAPRLRELVAEADPTAVVVAPTPLDEVYQDDLESAYLITFGGEAMVVILVMLAASGIYALMSFSVAARRHEIGVRSSLGATRSDIVRTISGRAFAQLAIGALIGSLIAWRLLWELKNDGGWIPEYHPLAVALLAAAGVVLLIGTPACVAPTLRALRIMPTEAMRSGS